jgi:hypothetical protein
MNTLNCWLLRILIGGAFVFLLALRGGDTGVLEPFNQKDLTGWKTQPGDGKSAWVVGSAKLDPRDPKRFVVSPQGQELINNTAGHGQSLDLYSEALHGDAIITLEVMVPKESNSGIYVLGEYEVQVLDSYGNDANPGPGDMGAIYGAQPPKGPRYLPPGAWNSYEIHFQAPRFDAQGKKTTNARFLKVVLNGKVIHENLDMPAATPGGVDGKEKAKGSLLFQGNHGAVAYRNIRIQPMKS